MCSESPLWRPELAVTPTQIIDSVELHVLVAVGDGVPIRLGTVTVPLAVSVDADAIVYVPLTPAKARRKLRSLLRHGLRVLR
jgi:hypothetical protein